MTREEKIKAIYAEMANKDVSFSCRYEHNGSVYTVDSGNYRLMKHGDSYYLYIDAHCNCPIKIVKLYNDFSNQGVVKIIGHPVMIGDVLDWLDKKICLLIDQGKDIEKLLKGSDALNLRLINIWKYKTKPLDEQPDHCIDYVTNLLDKFGSVI